MVSVLEKIKEEIDNLSIVKYPSGERIYKDEVMDIIDKYIKQEKNKK